MKTYYTVPYLNRTFRFDGSPLPAVMYFREDQKEQAEAFAAANQSKVIKKRCKYIPGYA